MGDKETKDKHNTIEVFSKIFEELVKAFYLR